jgi:hypothetical protein
LTEYAEALRPLAGTREFETSLEDRLIGKFLHGSNNEKTAFRFTVENLPFDRFVAKVCLPESVVDYSKDTTLSGSTVYVLQTVISKKFTSQTWTNHWVDLQLRWARIKHVCNAEGHRLG